ncbi:MAG: hypothetical protein K9L32_00385 [Chromatiaceae bacterium]|nr:hypothetical protein [Chromatiaceae bacterium]MCF8002662.1 hypothetical protein [Chromatiaceae bacterium]
MQRTQWNDDEDMALRKVTWMARLVYLQGIRRKMDYDTGIAGRSAVISYQALSEMLDCSEHTTQPDPRATKRMPDHRVEVHDLGLFLEPAIEAGYQSETFTRSAALASTLTLTDYERKRFTGTKRVIGYDKAEWINCERVEINAIPIRERIAYLEAQLEQIPGLLPKVQPPASVLRDRAQSITEQRITEQVRAEIERRLDLDAIVNAAVQRLQPLPDYNGEAVHRLIQRTLEQAPAQGWQDALKRIVGQRIKGRVPTERMNEAVNDAIAEQRGAA